MITNIIYLFRKSPFSERGSPDSGSATDLTGADLKLSRAAFSPEPETHYVVPNVIIQNNQLEGAFSTNSINKVPVFIFKAQWLHDIRAQEFVLTSSYTTTI